METQEKKSKCIMSMFRKGNRWFCVPIDWIYVTRILYVYCKFLKDYWKCT